MKVLNPELDPFSKDRSKRLRVPHERVLLALMPTGDSTTVPRLTGVQLAGCVEYSLKSGTITRALHGIQAGSASGKSHQGLLDLGLVEEVDLNGIKAYQITPAGREAVENLGGLPKPKDKGACTNHRYLGATLTREQIMEGRRLLKLHKFWERKPQIVKRKKQSVLQATGLLLCEACGFNFAAVYGGLGEGFAECHHRWPLAEYDAEAPTCLEDLAVVCANCHRMLHRSRLAMNVEDLQALIVDLRSEPGV
jgi:hypothetical protein